MSKTYQKLAPKFAKSCPKPAQGLARPAQGQARLAQGQGQGSVSEIFPKKQFWHHLGRIGSKSNENTAKLTGISRGNFDIFKISGRFWAPGPGPGPGPSFGSKILSKICNFPLGWAPNGPKWVYIRWDPLITY